MENKTPENENLRPKTTFLDRVAWSLRSFWRMLANNVWLKVLSLLLAILLWNYVISSNTSIPNSWAVCKSIPQSCNERHAAISNTADAPHRRA